MDRIPLYSAGGHFVGYVSQFEAEHLPGGTVTRNKRGNITRVRLKALTCHVVQFGDAGYGDEFLQRLRCGRVHALKGVTGSEK